MKNLFILSYLIFAYSSSSQTSLSTNYYNEAVNFYNAKDYKKADSLFSISIDIEPHKDTYFNRALCRGKMANKNGYCEDLAKASHNGEEKATSLFLKTCGKIDSTFVRLDQKYTTTTILSRIITYNYSDSLNIVFKQKYASQESTLTPISLEAVRATQEGEVFKIIETAAEFPGGVAALMQFITKNVIIPSAVKQKQVSGKVFLKFVVVEDGTVHDINILKGVPNCPECDEEATRLVAIMPKWKPASMDGKNVKCYFNLPISFK